jgi:hypothetical protein
MGTLTKQDVQALVDNARNKLSEKMLSRQEVQIACDSVREAIISHATQSMAQRNAVAKRVDIQLQQIIKKQQLQDQRLAVVTQELLAVSQLLSQLVHQKAAHTAHEADQLLSRQFSTRAQPITHY